MIRRKLTLYTLLFTTGITAGFLLLESDRAAEAVCLMLSALLCMRYLPYSAIDKNRIMLASVVLLASGFLLFVIRYCCFSAVISSHVCPDGDEGIVKIEGEVLSVTEKNDTLKITMRIREGHSAVKIQTKLYDHSRHPVLSDGTDEIYMLTGSEICCSGRYSVIRPADDPGCFDERLYMRSKGICLQFRADSISVKDMNDSLRNSFRRYLFRTREEFVDLFDEETAGFIRGVIFGDKSEMDDSAVREFNNNSTGHILAVSGLHMGFLYALLRILSGRRSNRSTAFIITLVMIIYGGMTGWSPATVRSCMVIALKLFSTHLRRPFDLLSAVSFSALVLLIYQPYQLFDSGFRLSFAAMLAIAFITEPLSILLGETLGVLLSVQIGTLPVIAYTFRRINLLSVFINIPVVMLASLLVPVCILILMLMLASGVIPEAGIRLAELCSYAIVRINHILSFDGDFSYRTAGVSAASVIAAYALLLGITSEWFRVNLIRHNSREIIRTACLAMIPLIILSVGLHDRFSDDEIVFVSVGQGDCTHIRAGGHDVLIDGGGTDERNTAEMILIPYLLYEGADRIDMALLTHLHKDHCKGIFELCDAFPVGAVGIPSDYRSSVEKAINEKKDQGGSESDDPVMLPEDPSLIRFIRMGMRIDISNDVFIESLWPPESGDKNIMIDDPNEHNMVYMIHYKGVKIMVTGDLTEQDELEMIEYYAKRNDTEAIRCDVLKAAHHGSKTSSSEAFLDAASPSVAVIQVGLNNFYGHPHSQTLERLSERGIRIYRTDINGAVGVDLRGGRLHIDTMRDLNM